MYVKVLKCTIPCIIGVCYRPPNQSKINRDATLESLRAQFDQLCMGSKLPFSYLEILMTDAQFGILIIPTVKLEMCCIIWSTNTICHKL